MAESLLAALLAATLIAAPPVTSAAAPSAASKPTSSPGAAPSTEPASPPAASTPSAPSSGDADASSAADATSASGSPDEATDVPDAPPADPVTRAPAAPTSAPDLSSGTATPEGPAPAPGVAVTDRYACHGSVPCQRLVALSAVTGALGLAGVATGVALALRPIRVDPDDPTTAITYRPAGTAVLTIGLGLLTTSVLMILTANRASRRALQKRTRQPVAQLRTTLAP